MTPGSVLAPSRPTEPVDGQTRFLTGEAVHLDVRVARLGSRVLAKLIDAVVQVALAIVISIGLSLLFGLGAIIGIVSFDSTVIAVAYIVAIVASFVAYPVVMETVTRGRTFGKLVLGLRVVRDDGGPITFRQALARGLVGMAIEWPGLLLAPLTWLATIWAMLASPQSKRIGDHFAGTVVIHERTPAAWGWIPQMPPDLAGWAQTLDLTGLGDDVALSVRQYLARNRQIREPARTQLGIRLASEVVALTNPPPPPGVPGWAYLAAVHAERHRRAMLQLGAVRARAAAVWPELATTAVNAPGRPPLVYPAAAAPPGYPGPSVGAPPLPAPSGPPVSLPPVPAQPVRSAVPPS